MGNPNNLVLYFHKVVGFIRDRLKSWLVKINANKAKIFWLVVPGMGQAPNIQDCTFPIMQPVTFLLDPPSLANNVDFGLPGISIFIIAIRTFISTVWTHFDSNSILLIPPIALKDLQSQFWRRLSSLRGNERGVCVCMLVSKLHSFFST